MSVLSFHPHLKYPPSPAQPTNSTLPGIIKGTIVGLRTPPDEMSSAIYQGPPRATSHAPEQYVSSAYRSSHADFPRCSQPIASSHSRFSVHAHQPHAYAQRAQELPTRTGILDSQPRLPEEMASVPPQQSQPQLASQISQTSRNWTISSGTSVPADLNSKSKPHLTSTSIRNVSSVSSQTRRLSKDVPLQSLSPKFDLDGDEKEMVRHSLFLPKKIDPRRSSLPDFAAQACCLFWFESFEVLDLAEKLYDGRRTVMPLTRPALPEPQYKKWVHGIISTTQVSVNVVLLALLFVHRLKHTTRTVRPQPGSEYRLLTVALMLGNKFLDDNTYTNKTWAEVSCISVQEIHVMEVEFLANMRYDLYTNKSAWKGWIVTLKNVFDYLERAQPRQPSPLAVASPHTIQPSPIPSPTGSTFSGIFPATTPTSRQGSLAPNWSFSGGSPLSQRPLFDPISRKRSFEGDPTEPPAKRAAKAQGNIQTTTHIPLPIPASAAYSATVPPVTLPHTLASHAPQQDTIRLPAPNLSLNTQITTHVGQSLPINTYTSQPNLSLPPISHGVRAISTIYPTTTAGPTPTSSVFASQPASVAAPVSSTAPAFPPFTSGYQTPTKRRSPTNLRPSIYATSPLGDSFHNGIHTPISQSPSAYLENRPSPYRPVRRVNALLCPPPSASLHQFHLTPSQMQYHTLGRRDEIRTGIAPDYRNYLNSHAKAVPSVSTTAALHRPSLTSVQPPSALHPALH